MVDQQQTIAILGSSPLAALLAGLLAADHSRNVLWVRDSRRQSLLPRDIATSVAPITRPETWRLLQATTAETSRRLARLDGAMLERSDALFYARQSYPRTALLHMRHTATAYGHAVESDVSNGAEGRLALRMRDALSLGRARFWKAILPWLERSGVTFVDDTIAVAPARGRVGDVVCDRIVLADDTAIRTHVDPAEIAAFGRETAYRSVLTAPVGPLPAPLIFNADADVQIHQRANGTLEIIARDDAQPHPHALRPFWPVGSTRSDRVKRGSWHWRHGTMRRFLPRYGAVALSHLRALARPDSFSRLPSRAICAMQPMPRKRRG
jgi:hypothetical protein